MDKKLQLALCDMQGQLFEMSKVAGYDSESFISAFMTYGLDADFNHVQWVARNILWSALKMS